MTCCVSSAFIRIRMSDMVRGAETVRSQPGYFRIAAMVAVLTGAVGSVACTLFAGRRNPSGILVTLFVLWVLAPFVGLAWAGFVSTRWPVLTRNTLYSVMLLLTLACLAIYGNAALHPPATRGAFIFLVLPPASCLFAAIAVSVAALLSRRKSG